VAVCAGWHALISGKTGIPLKEEVMFGFQICLVGCSTPVVFTASPLSGIVRVMQATYINLGATRFDFELPPFFISIRTSAIIRRIQPMTTRHSSIKIQETFRNVTGLIWSFFRPLHLLMAPLVFCAVSASAAQLTWDAGHGQGAGVIAGSGNWDITTTNWYNGSTDVAWAQTSTTAPLATNAVFGGADAAAGTYQLRMLSKSPTPILSSTPTGMCLAANPCMRPASGICSSPMARA